MWGRSGADSCLYRCICCTGVYVWMMGGGQHQSGADNRMYRCVCVYGGGGVERGKGFCTGVYMWVGGGQWWGEGGEAWASPSTC